MGTGKGGSLKNSKRNTGTVSPSIKLFDSDGEAGLPIFTQDDLDDLQKIQSAIMKERAGIGNKSSMKREEAPEETLRAKVKQAQIDKHAQNLERSDLSDEDKAQVPEFKEWVENKRASTLEINEGSELGDDEIAALLGEMDGFLDDDKGFLADMFKVPDPATDFADYDYGRLEQVALGDVELSQEDIDQKYAEFREKSENGFQWSSAILKKVVEQADSDPSMRLLALRLAALAEMRQEAKSSLRSDAFKNMGDMASQIEKEGLNGHLQYLKAHGGQLEKDPANLNLEDGESFYGDKTPLSLYYYKALLSHPKGREFLQEKMDNGFPDQITPYNAANATQRTQMRAVLDKYAAPIHSMSHEGVDKIRQVIELEQGQMPDFIGQALADQPVSQNIYRLLAVDVSGEGGSWTNYPDDPPRNPPRRIRTKEQSAIKSYTGSGFSSLNNLFRNVSTYLEGYQGAKDEDVRKMFASQLANTIAEAKKSGLLKTATHLMNGLARGMDGNKPMVLTRGATESPMKVANYKTGRYFYDSAFSSAADKENRRSGWANRKTQFIVVTDRYADVRGISSYGEGEAERILFPGTIFKVDFSQRYKAPHGYDSDVIAARQVDVDEGFAHPIKPAKLRKLKHRESISDHEKSKRGKYDVGEYEKRLSDVGGIIRRMLLGDNASEPPVKAPGEPGDRLRLEESEMPSGDKE